MPTIITAGALAAKGYGFGSAASAGPAVYVEDVFSTWLYTGNGTGQTITNGIDLATNGGLVWTKMRSAGESHTLIDTVRGRTKYLMTDSTAGEFNIADFTAFSTTGYILGSDISNRLNASSQLYVSWTFREQAKFFDIVTYTGTNTTNPVAHSLGVSPGFIIIKAISGTSNWGVVARYPSLTTGYITGLSLNSTAAAFAGFIGVFPPVDTITSATFDPQYIFDDSLNQMNESGSTYIAYLFAHDPTANGLIQCGSYTGNGSASGPTVTLGWEPQFVLIKNASSTGGWNIFDNMRGIATGGNDPYLFANSAAAEATTNGDLIDLTPTGFVIKSTNSQVNTSGNNYIYMAIRRGPMRTPTDATKVFTPINSNTVYNTFQTTNFPIDTQFMRNRASTISMIVVDKMRGVSSNTTQNSGPFLDTTSTAAEQTTQGTSLGWENLGYRTPNYVAGAQSIFYNLRRAPGFFDVVCYSGIPVDQNVNHSLGVVPELIIVKNRNGSFNWIVYNKTIGNSYYVQLQGTNPSQYGNYWNFTSPTASVFTVTQTIFVNEPGYVYVAYLFASCPGVSKVGSYTGTGAAQNIDCGFSAPARFVLIKRTSATGDWFVYDTARGMSAGNDPYLLINSTAAEVTGTNYVDTFATGFALTAAAPAELNSIGGTFIFLAIA